MAANMKRQCSNHPKYMYSGKEASPLGLGIAAEPIAPGTIQEGRDKTNWIVTLKNGVKVWSRITRLSEVLDTDRNTRTLKEHHNIQDEPVPKKKAAAPRKKQAAALEKENGDTLTHEDETENVDGVVSDAANAAKDLAKRKPTSYNIYMKYRLKQLVKENTTLKPKERITHAVAQWKSMTADEKADIVKKAMAALENGEI